jgi:glutaredoxin
MKRKNVYLFKMDTCHHCKNLMELLSKEGIKYKTIDTDNEKEIFNIVSKTTGFDHVPQLLVNEWNGKEFINSKYISDFDTLKEAVEQVKFLLLQNTDNQEKEK